MELARNCNLPYQIPPIFRLQQKPMLINYVDSLKVWGLRPHTPPLTTSGDLLRLKLEAKFNISNKAS
jgi:hypothetical protein